MSMQRLLPILLCTMLALLAGPAVADYLMTHDGDRITTIGSWQVDGQQIRYVDPQRQTQLVEVATIDLDASRQASADAQDVKLYATSWCGYCRRARQLLDSMDVLFVEHDIERDPRARAEMAELVGGRSGVPVLSIDGKIIRGFRADMIRQLVDEMRQRKAADASKSVTK